MKKHSAFPRLSLEDAIAAVRDDEMSAAEADRIGARVRQGLDRRTDEGSQSLVRIRGCADVQSLLPRHRRGELPAAQALLVADHLAECATCRAADRQPDGPRLAVLPWRGAARPASPRAGQTSWGRWAAAAVVLLSVGVGSMAVRRSFFGVPAGRRAVVRALSGVLQVVRADGARALAPGEEIGEGEPVRTGLTSQAVLQLRDGSTVELGERAEVSVTARGQDTTLHLGRGNVIVQAAKRRTGHLLVASRDCTVYVTGTVFSVNAGLKGSRVSVLEGNVRVVQGGAEKNLRAGEQLATNSDLPSVSVRDEIAWSRNLDQHLALLRELSAFRKDLQAVPMPGLRYESRLMRLVPEQAVVFASLPNYGAALGQASRLFEERLAQNATLREWWEQAGPRSLDGPRLAAALEKVRTFADYLGDEIVFAAMDGQGRSRPLLLAEVRRPGLREFLEAELSRSDGPPRGEGLALLGADDLPTARGGADLLVLLTPDLVAIGDDAAVLRGVARRQRDGGSALPETAFGRRILQSYQAGVALLFGADLERVARALAARSDHAPEAARKFLGLDDVSHLIVESKEVTGRAQSQAVLSFAGPRRGIASWLGAPGPMASLEFVSARAVAAATFMVKSPSLLLDDLLAAAEETGARSPLADLESRLKVRIREDIAETLGGEVTFALDGPLLPTPAWKVVGEVYDPARLESAIQSVVESWNEEASRSGQAPIRLEAELVDGRTYYALQPPKASVPFELHYTFADGYLVAAGSRALVMRALRVRETGEDLAHAAAFRSLLSRDGRLNVSALVYQNFGSLANSARGALGSGIGNREQREAVRALAGNMRPSLVYAYGEESRILVAGTGGLLSLDPGSVALPMMFEQWVSQNLPAPDKR